MITGAEGHFDGDEDKFTIGVRPAMDRESFFISVGYDEKAATNFDGGDFWRGGEGPVLGWHGADAAAVFFLDVFSVFLVLAIDFDADGFSAREGIDDQHGVGHGAEAFFPRVLPLGGRELAPDVALSHYSLAKKKIKRGVRVDRVRV
jgi:hypothetical protein